MIIRHTPEQVADYYARAGLNQSGIKEILKGGVEKYLLYSDSLQKEKDYYYEEKEYFVIGSGVDAIISYGREVFNQSYHISTMSKKPGDKVMSVVKLAYDKAKIQFPLGPDTGIHLYAQQVYDACNEEKYYENRKKEIVAKDKRIETIIKENGNAYWLDLIMAEGKQVLSDEQSKLINIISNSLLNHKFTSHLFKDSKHIDIVYQLPMYWEYAGVQCKGMLDMLIINHQQKKLFPIDIKTHGDTLTSFNRAARKRRYDIQGAFYTLGLSATLVELTTLLNKPVMDYTIANFAFVAESTVNPGTPLIFPFTSELLEQGVNGDNVELLGYNQAIEKYKIWGETGFNLEQTFDSSNGVLFIDKDFKFHKNF